MKFIRILPLAEALAAILTAGATAFNGAAQTSAQSAPDTLRLSLERCIEIALDENPTIKVADLEIKRMDYSRRETLGQLLPSVSFSANYNRTLAKQTMYMNMGAFGGGAAGGEEGEQPESRAAEKNTGIKVGLDNSWSLGFSASMPLIAPQLWKSLDISDSRILESVEQARSSKLSLVNQVKSAYYALLLAHDSRKALQESYEMAVFTADLYAKQFDNGTATRYDVLRTSVAVKNIEPELLQTDIAISQARLQLAILMGMNPADGVVEADCSLADLEKTIYDNLLPAAQTGIGSNSSLRQLDIQARQLDQNVTLQKFSFIPTLALTANYNWTTMNNGSPFRNLTWNPYSMLGITLQVPLFEGLQRHSRLRQAQVQSREMTFRREDLVRSLNMQAELALENINRNIKQIESCTESVRQAMTAHDIMKESFEIGAASYLELRDSEVALTQSRLALSQAFYNCLVAESELELLYGNAPQANK